MLMQLQPRMKLIEVKSEPHIWTGKFIQRKWNSVFFPRSFPRNSRLFPFSTISFRTERGEKLGRGRFWCNFAASSKLGDAVFGFLVCLSWKFDGGCRRNPTLYIICV